MANDTSWLRNRMAASAAALLAGAALVAGGVAAVPAPAGADEPAAQTQSAATTIKTVSGTYDAAGAKALLERVNEIRAEAGVAPVSWSDTLAVAAQTRAAEASVSLSSTRPDGTLYSTVSSQTKAENLATAAFSSDSTSSAASLLETWYAEKDSYDAGKTSEASHYANLVNPNLTHIGLGMFTDAAGTSYLVSEQGADVVEDDRVLPADGAASVSVSVLDTAAGANGTTEAGVDGVDGGSVVPTADGDSQQPVASVVTPSWAADAVVSCDYGATPALPETVTVFWSDDTTTEESVAWEWDGVDEVVKVAGSTFTVDGTVAVASTGTTLDVEATVTVGAAPIVAVQLPADIVTEKGVPATLPDVLGVTLADETTTTAPVTWEAVDDAQWSSDAGSFDVRGYVDGWDQEVAQHVVLTDPVAPAEDGADGSTDGKPGMDTDAPSIDGADTQNGSENGASEDGAADQDAYRYVKSFTEPSTLYVWASDEEWEPAPLACVYGDDTAGLLNLAWTFADGTAFDASQAATYVDENGKLALTAQVKVLDDEGNAQDTPVTQEVQLFDGLSDTETLSYSATVGDAAAGMLPATLSMMYGDAQFDVPVTWDSLPEDAVDAEGALAKAGDFTLTGMLSGGPFAVEATLSVSEAAPAITGVTNPADVTTTAGTAPALPETVEVTYEDGTTGSAKVTWDEVDATQYLQAGTFKVSGAVEGTSLVAEVTVVVQAAQRTATSIEAVTVETTAGTAPVLPDAVRVTWDDGSQTEEAVTWDAVEASSYAKTGQFVVSGTIAGDASARATCTVTVKAAAATPQSAANPAAVSTKAGTAPVLPATVTVTYTDGTTQQVEVNWNAVDEASYHNGGSFVVAGTVRGTDLTVQVTVNVADKTVTGIQNNLAVKTTAGTAPALPATASVRWSNGDVTNEAVSWNGVSPSQYAQAGTFNVTGTVAGYTVSCAVTVEAAQQQVAKTGDATNMVPVVIGAVVGVAAVAAAVVLILRSRKK